MLNSIKPNQINQIIEIVLECAELAVHDFKAQSFEVYNKDDNTKVTSTDIKISDIINKYLSKIFPQIPIICEEGQLKNTNASTFFLIDPIDGTSSFIKNNSEFCINIALIENLKPIFGVICAPLFEDGKLFYNDLEQNIISINYKNNTHEKINKSLKSNNSLKIITSARTNNDDLKKLLQQLYPTYQNNFIVEKLSSAIKFLRIIEGKHNLYVHFNKSMEWDIAAGHALIKLAGHNIFKLETSFDKFFIGEEIGYNKTKFVNGGFIIPFFA